jgi:replicative DNA helicase
MPVCGLPQLFAQSLSKQSWREFRRNELTAPETAAFIDSIKEVQANKKIHIYDRDRTLAQLTARIKAFHQIKPIKGIVIDYLQRYDPQQDRGETRDVAIGRMTMAIKDAAIECGIPIVLLAQISRSVERENREPMLSDLRESGNIEQDADRVIFLDAPTNTPDGSTQDLNDGAVRRIFVNAIQAKGRGEGQDRVGMMFNRPITSFESIVHF